ncbi:MAG: SbcC/MukB-like Walker B domain-containing protein, partial [Xanthomarina sp.]
TNSKLKLGLVHELKIALTHYNSELKNKSTKEAELKGSEGLFKTYELDLKKLEDELKLLQIEVDKLTKEEENRKKHHSLEQHRSLLVDHEACPLCGALEHPFATNKPIFDLQEDILKSKNDLLKSKNHLKISLQTNLVNEQKKSKVLKDDILGIQETMKPKFLEIENLCKNLQVVLIQNIADVHVLEKKLTHEIQIVEQVKKAFELRKLLINLKETSNQWLLSLKVKREKETKRKQLYVGDDIHAKVQTLNSKWAANVQDVINTSKLISLLKNKTSEIFKEKIVFEKQLNNILEKEKIESIPKLKSLILPEVKAEEIRQKKNNLQLKQAALETEKETALKEMDSFRKQITTPETIAELELKHHKNEADFEILSKRIVTIENQLDLDKKTKQKQEVLLAKLKDLKKEETLWKTMNGLIGDANGKRFSNFVQDLTLEQLIGYANLRLKDLSDRYILDIPTADEADKNDSLKVFDCHQGDARRSINTLSGGETFMVSLAMAFALSDLAAKNVKIESIFIDEGFGTLDPETLNQAITILEKMQNEGDKSIGVISHVEALKERISTQIRLEKLGSGYSTIEIV